MTRLELAPEIIEDFDRILDHLLDHESPAVASRIGGIIEALDILARHPQIGRPRAALRELVIGRGSEGYVALYRYIEEADTVLVLAIRSQREAGYKHS